MSLRTKFCGKELRAPFGSAALAMSSPSAASAQNYADRLLKWIDYGAGIVSTLFVLNESLKDYPTEKEPTFLWGRCRREEHNFLYVQADMNCIVGRLEEGLEIIRIVKEKSPPDVLVQANIIAKSTNPGIWAEHAKLFEEAGADQIELDTSCSIWIAGDVCLLSDRPEEVSAVINEITKNVKIPVGIKMTPETGFPRFIQVAKAVHDAGGKFVSCANAVVGVNPIDIYNGGRPDKGAYPMTKNQFVALIGASRQIARKQVAGIKLTIPDIEVVGITGIVKPEDVIDYIMLGAQITELSSGIMFYGGKYIKKVKDFLEKFMAEQGYESIEDFRGLALKEFEVDSTNIDYGFGERLAVTDEFKCTGCGFCVESQCYASCLRDGVAIVLPDECTGCGLCVHICPQEARTMIVRDKPRHVGIDYSQV